jgi:hypothetical protein
MLWEAEDRLTTFAVRELENFLAVAAAASADAREKKRAVILGRMTRPRMTLP